MTPPSSLRTSVENRQQETTCLRPDALRKGGTKCWGLWLPTLAGLLIGMGSFAAEETKSQADREDALRSQARLWREAEQRLDEGKWAECRQALGQMRMLERVAFDDSPHALLCLTDFLDAATPPGEKSTAAVRQA